VSDEEFDRLLNAWFGNLTRVLLPGRGFNIWGGYAGSSYTSAPTCCRLQDVRAARILGRQPSSEKHHEFPLELP
jgi:hypothetical protein